MSRQIKLLDDFRRHGLIGRWFGELRLLGVSYSARLAKTIPNVICRVVCASGHESTRTWRALSGAQGTCRKCAWILKGTRPITALSKHAMGAQIDALEPVRRQLFDALLSSRRRAAGQVDTSDRELVGDALAYAQKVPDPAAELEEIGTPNVYVCAGAGSSLAAPSFIYAGVE